MNVILLQIWQTIQGCVSQKHCKLKVHRGPIETNGATINLSLRCFWETQSSVLWFALWRFLFQSVLQC